MIFYRENINTKIKVVIENYIKKEKLGESMKYKFFYNDKLIDDLEKTIAEIKITTLGVIITK